MVVRQAVLTGLVLLCMSARAWSQTAADPLPARSISVPLIVAAADSRVERLRDVQEWTKEYTKWRTWFAEWRNRREPGWLTTRDRRQPPEPPAWLPATCSTLLDEAGPVVDGCRALREWARNDYLVDVLTEQVVQTRADQEAPKKSSWWQHVHLDALWPMTQAGSSVLGVCGVHATLDVSKRVQVFLAPGAILMRLPAPDGARWTPATDWGFSYRLFDFRMPATRRPAALHMNIAKVWVFGATPLPIRGELYLAGLSVTFNPR